MPQTDTQAVQFLGMLKAGSEKLFVVHVGYPVEEKNEALGANRVGGEQAKQLAQLHRCNVNEMRNLSQGLKPALDHQDLRAQRRVRGLRASLGQQAEDVPPSSIVEGSNTDRRSLRTGVVKVEDPELGQEPLGDDLGVEVLLGIGHVPDLGVVPLLRSVCPTQLHLGRNLPGVQNGEPLGDSVVSCVAQIQSVMPSGILDVPNHEVVHLVQYSDDVGHRGRELEAQLPGRCAAADARQQPAQDVGCQGACAAELRHAGVGHQEVLGQGLEEHELLLVVTLVAFEERQQRPHLPKHRRQPRNLQAPGDEGAEGEVAGALQRLFVSLLHPEVEGQPALRRQRGARPRGGMVEGRLGCHLGECVHSGEPEALGRAVERPEQRAVVGLREVQGVAPLGFGRIEDLRVGVRAGALSGAAVLSLEVQQPTLVTAQHSQQASCAEDAKWIVGDVQTSELQVATERHL
mmetsp:Transcript_68605/g.223179  ORF Transcript_68605/g.223179 Transcript_68605/m.223179 type:complete len:460 (-) Transcript_68605:1783-3162(-)